ncbi:MAG TPA: LacI family DNA-binding transcriptional regulator [Acidimicrobiales bacterium]|nr:LacI family DNA-binding transcriptional regulator [Acidimicrobiales bacterium]
MPVTIDAVARQAGVSISTVSRAVHGQGGLGARTRARVLDVVDQLGYVPNHVARSLVSARSESIGVLVTDNQSPVYAGVLRGIEEVANDHGYTILLANSADVEERALRCTKMFEARQVDGLIVAPTRRAAASRPPESPRSARSRPSAPSQRPAPPPARQVRQPGDQPPQRPTVAVVRRPDDPDTDCVVTDNEDGGYRAASHLLELGHRRIAHIGGIDGVSSTDERCAGFCRALLEQGVAVDDATVSRGSHTIASGYAVALEMLRGGGRPTGLYVATLPQALGVLKAARRLGVLVPRDVSVVAGDGADYAEFLAVPLTTVDQPTYEIGHRAATLLFERLAGRPGAIQHVELAPQLSVRESTDVPPALRPRQRRGAAGAGS